MCVCVTRATVRSRRSRRPLARRKTGPRSRTEICVLRGPAPVPSVATPSSARRSEQRPHAAAALTNTSGGGTYH